MKIHLPRQASQVFLGVVIRCGPKDTLTVFSHLEECVLFRAISPSVPMRPRPPVRVYPSAEGVGIQYFYSFVLETGAGAAMLVLPYTICICYPWL